MRFNQLVLGVVPTHQIEQHLEGEYESKGDDPQFDIRPAAGIGAVARGWYRFSARVTLLEGEVVAPCFYPDYGDGPSEASRIELPEPDDDGRIDAVILIREPLRALRFDPTIRPARFRLEAPTLRRLSRAGALLGMLGGIREATGRTGDAVDALRAFARHAAMGCLTVGADHVVRRYLDAHRKATRDYSRWVSLFDNGSPECLELARARVAALPLRPLISIVVPTHNTPIHFLHKCIRSVMRQSYPDWQLCIADDASSPDVVRVLKAYADKDPRIALHLRSGHGHICETSNDALALATGSYVGFLDHDDELSQEALYEVAAAIGHHPGGRLFYSDEDKIDAAGERSVPNFKPAWNPELLRSQNYICHFTVIDAALVREVGGFRPGFEGAQDHDLLLRCTERLQRHEIAHIPKVLYHWRALPGSTALTPDEKPYAQEAGRRAVAQHLERIGIEAQVEVTAAGYYRAKFPMAEVAPPVTIFIPTRDRKQLLSACVESILEKTSYPNFHIVVVDNGTVEEDAVRYLEQLRQHERVTVLEYPGPFNYSAIINHAVARYSSGELLCILNNDVEIISLDWLEEMVAHAIRPEVGVVGCMLYYPDDTIQHAGVVLGIGGIAGHIHLRLPRGSSGYLGRAGVAQNYTAVTGACMVMRRSVFDDVAGLDEGLQVAFNDIDFCIRVSQRGYDNVWTPHAELYHHESASRGPEDTPEKRARFRSEADRMKAKWGAFLDHDPAYNPNLSLESANFEVAFPPRKQSRMPLLHAALAFPN